MAYERTLATWISCVETCLSDYLGSSHLLNMGACIFFEFVLGCNGFVLSLIDNLSVDNKASGVILSILRFVSSISSLSKVLVDVGYARARFIKVQY